ncbi:hypothetical protein [Deinococcus hohokamensis]|uniref:Lipoprotein n=1 Tax=Deinococcus hohokamensis TaxID=309883 RepID=A0ABV9I637_9DEIO
MRRPFRLLPLLVPALLGSCARQTDTFKPRITITSGGGSGVSRQNAFTVEGYVLDDVGVTAITVDDRPVPLEPGSRKLAHFRFQAQVEGGRGQYTIAARDAAGNRGTLSLPVTVDAQGPLIKISRFERSGNLIRVSGVVTDNTRVAQVLVDGNRLNISPGPRVEFYAETSGIWADVEAVDAAGNVRKQRAR